MNTIQEATDGAKYVEWHNNQTFAVWHGGHTVNFYSLIPGSHQVEPTTSISVGDFESGNVTLQEVKEGIESAFEMDE